MLRRPELCLYLGYLADSAPPGPDRREFGFLRALGELYGEREVPVHWLLPPLLFEGPRGGSQAELMTVLRERIERGLDRVVAVGFRGAFHPLLRLREVERELRWAVRNPWGSGIARSLSAAPVAAFALHPDFGRPGMSAVYRDAGIDSVLFLRPSRGEPYVPLYRDPASGMRFLAAIRAADAPGLVRGLGAPPGGRPPSCFLLFDGSLAEREAFELLAALARRRALDFRSWPDAELAPVDASPARVARLADGALPSTPGARHRWLRAEPLRKSRRNADVKKLLDAFSPREPAEEAALVPEGETSPLPRLHSSVMPGVVTLSGPGLDARLDEGFLCGLYRRGEPLFPLSRLRSYLAVGRAERAFAPVSVASFEQERGSGLRSMMTQEGASLVVDYLFEEGLPALLVAVHVSYPPLPRAASAVVPFGIAVELGRRGSATIRCLGEEGVRGERRIDGAERPGEILTVAGGAFVLEAGGASLCLSFPGRATLGARPLQCALLQARQGRLLLLNPLGTFRPAEAPAYSSMREELTLLLAPGDAPPELPRSLLGRIVGHRVLRAPGHRAAGP